MVQDEMTDRPRHEIRQEPPGTAMIADDTAICSESRCSGGGGGGGVKTLEGRGLEVSRIRAGCMCVDETETARSQDVGGGGQGSTVQRNRRFGKLVPEVCAGGLEEAGTRSGCDARMKGKVWM